MTEEGNDGQEFVARCEACRGAIWDTDPDDSWHYYGEDLTVLHVDCTPDDEPMHVYPVSDAREHELTEECWCRPGVEMFDPDTQKQHPVPFVVHRDAEQRAKEAS